MQEVMVQEDVIDVHDLTSLVDPERHTVKKMLRRRYLRLVQSVKLKLSVSMMYGLLRMLQATFRNVLIVEVI